MPLARNTQGTDTVMAATSTLNGPSLPPASGGKAKQLVMLLHGVGADGNDLIGLAPFFQQVLPDALFVSPNAPQRFDMAPWGYQWFSIRNDSDPTQFISDASKLNGALAALPVLNTFIDEQLAAHGLTEADMALIGFSQGTMMSLQAGLRREKALAGIVGYSGVLLGVDLLAKEIKSRPPVLLVHGDADAVLPVSALPAAEAALKKLNVPVEAHIHAGLAHGIDETGIRRGQAFLAKVFGA